MGRLAGRSNRLEAGSTTVHAIVLICVLTTTAMLAAAGAGLVAGHRRAASAADLAALAGASAIQQGESGCTVAGEVARANDTQMISCHPDGDVLTVEVAVEVDSAFSRSFTLRGRARAGPAL